jgi:hypothetical protein
LSGEERFRGRDWDEIESEARREWQQRNPDTAWDDVKEAIQHAWRHIKGDSGAYPR